MFQSLYSILILTGYLYGWSPTVTQLLQEGAANGNKPYVFSVVGDSISDEYHFLNPIGDGHTVLAEYEYLRPTLDMYLSTAARENSNSFSNMPISAAPGWYTGDVLDPLKSQSFDYCLQRSPLNCEYDLVKPSIAIIMIGTNDASWGVPIPDFERNYRTILHWTLQYKILPILSTMPHNGVNDIRPYNEVVWRLAQEYQLPLMDYYAVMMTLPSIGLREDYIHPNYPEHGNAADFNQGNLVYGYTVRNLLVLEALQLTEQWRITQVSQVQQPVSVVSTPAMVERESVKALHIVKSNIAQ